MPEGYDHLIDDPIGSHSSADELHGHAWGIVRNEIILIEAFQICISDASCECRDMVHVCHGSIQYMEERSVALTGLFDHGSHCCRGILGSKLDWTM